MEKGNAVIGWVAAVFVVAALLFVALKVLPARQESTTVENEDETSVVETPEAQEALRPSLELQTLLDAIVAEKGDYAVAVVEPNGRMTNTNGDKQFTAASTYKLFIAYGLFDAINSGDMRWSEVVVSSRDAETCFQMMIVNSDNDCPEAFGNRIGWQKINDQMRALGLTNTRVKFHDNATTANDLSLFLTKLRDGDLLNEADSQKLISYMKQQQYRDGIPAGTGAEVADKPGFLDALIHDAGIVYGQNGAYVLVIMSNGSTWSELADAANQIHNSLEQ